MSKRFRTRRFRRSVNRQPCPGPRCFGKGTIYQPPALCETCYRALPTSYQKEMCSTDHDYRLAAFNRALELLNLFGTSDAAFRSPKPPKITN